MLIEPRFVLTQHHICINQRAPAEATRDDRADALERPHIEHALLAFRRIPEVQAQRAGRPRKRTRWVGLTPFQKADAVPAILREPLGDNGTTESAAYHQDIGLFRDIADLQTHGSRRLVIGFLRVGANAVRKSNSTFDFNRAYSKFEARPQIHAIGPKISGGYRGAIPVARYAASM